MPAFTLDGGTAMDNLTQTAPNSGSPPPPPDLTGQTLGDFRVLRKLGQGGMGQVYLAEQVSLTRKVALKLLKAELAANPNALERFKHEAKSVARATIGAAKCNLDDPDAGLPAIREWMKETIRKYNFRVEPTAVARANDQTAVSVTIAGDFRWIWRQLSECCGLVDPTLEVTGPDHMVRTESKPVFEVAVNGQAPERYMLALSLGGESEHVELCEVKATPG